MAVEDPQAPGRQHEDADAREHDPGELDGQLVLVLGEAGHEQVGERPREQDADQADDAGERGEQAGDCAGQVAGLLVAALGAQAGVDGDERGRQHPLAEQVLHEVGDAQRGLERVGGRSRAEEGGGDHLPDQPGAARQQDAGGDQQRAAGVGPGGGLGLGGRRSGAVGRSGLGRGTIVGQASPRDLVLRGVRPPQPTSARPSQGGAQPAWPPVQCHRPVPPGRRPRRPGSSCAGDRARRARGHLVARGPGPASRGAGLASRRPGVGPVGESARPASPQLGPSGRPRLTWTARCIHGPGGCWAGHDSGARPNMSAGRQLPVTSSGAQRPAVARPPPQRSRHGGGGAPRRPRAGGAPATTRRTPGPAPVRLTQYSSSWRRPPDPPPATHRPRSGAAPRSSRRRRRLTAPRPVAGRAAPPSHPPPG